MAGRTGAMDIVPAFSVMAPSLRSRFRQRAPFGFAQDRLPPAKRLNFDCAQDRLRVGHPHLVLWSEA